MLPNSEEVYLKALTYPIAVQLDEIAEELIFLKPGEDGNLQLIDISQKLDRVYQAAHNAIYVHLCEEGFQMGTD